ncbi:TPA: hypothetical protein QEM96_000952 [Pseudomonas putida]|nr:hypothetical protein [Pseudomonas putida]
MDPFDASALKLQKNLLTLRQTRDRLRREGNHAQADELAQQIARIETVLATVSGAVKPPTLQ